MTVFTKETTKENYILEHGLTFQETFNFIEKYTDEYGESHLYVTDAYLYYNCELSEALEQTSTDINDVPGGRFFVTYDI